MTVGEDSASELTVEQCETGKRSQGEGQMQCSGFSSGFSVSVVLVLGFEKLNCFGVDFIDLNLYFR